MERLLKDRTIEVPQAVSFDGYRVRNEFNETKETVCKKVEAQEYTQAVEAVKAFRETVDKFLTEALGSSLKTEAINATVSFINDVQRGIAALLDYIADAAQGSGDREGCQSAFEELTGINVEEACEGMSVLEAVHS